MCTLNVCSQNANLFEIIAQVMFHVIDAQLLTVIFVKLNLLDTFVFAKLNTNIYDQGSMCKWQTVIYGL